MAAPGGIPPVSAKEPLPPRPLATSATASEPRPVDIVLLPGNVLAGAVVDADGVPRPDANLVVLLGHYEIARGKTDQAGEFAIAVPRGGVYLVASGRSVTVVRAWTATAAPPAAQYRVTLSPQSTVARGQSPAGRMDPLLGLLLVGGVAAAIAIPIALNNNGHD
ncbi:MAG TPA: hypothetical protein VK137_16440, partial [Planctomycetaceae bacterium]|nr:hypothetical protein [Planctomycetaceae bacterium]